MSLLPGLELLNHIRSGGKRISDGAIGTELMQNGIIAAEVLRANVDCQTSVRNLYASYLDAGAEILTANTFGISTGPRWATEVRTGIQLAFDACASSANKISAWVTLVPRVIVTEIDTVKSLVRDVTPQPDMFLIETCTSLTETLAAIDAIGELNPAVLCVTCHVTADSKMLDGTDIDDAVLAITRAGASIVGANCGDDPVTFHSILSKIRSVVSVPTLFQPSAGLPVFAEDGKVLNYPLSPDEFSILGLELFSSGADIVGGCCGTTPAHITALSRIMRECKA